MKRTRQSSRKLQKLPNVEQVIRPSPPDRLSSLPDSVLCHILSFVPTKDSVATSTLARRWRFIWTEVPVLDFDNEDGLAKPDYDMSFPDIVNRVMLLHNVRCLNTFRLSFVWSEEEHQGFSMYQVHRWTDTWIRTAIARNVQALHLYKLRLPHCLFTSKTLVDLRLDFCEMLFDSSVCLPSLKKLNLHSVQYQDEDTLPWLFLGCPVLEELTVQQICGHDVACYHITSSTIKWLVLDFQYDDYEYHSYKLEIHAPALKYLRLEDRLFEHISAETLNSLVEADICLNNYKEDEDDLYSRSVLKFVEKLCQVKCLKLSSGYTKLISWQLLDSAFAAATMRFHNLTKLELGADLHLLIKFLENADNLEVLIIGEVDEDDTKCWMEPRHVPTCLTSHLREVTINPFGCLDDEFQLVCYILRNAKVLNMMKVHAHYLDSNYESKFNVLQEISRYELGSENCKLEFF